MLWAYMDETGIHDKTTGHYKHLAIGGAIAEFCYWQTLEKKWRDALNDYGLNAFHMSHFEAYDYEFSRDKGWTEARHKQFLNRLLHIIWESNIRTCFAAGTLAPKEQKGRTWFPAIYKRCVRRMLTDLLEQADQADYIGSGDRQIRAVFAKHQEINYPALSHYYARISRGLPRPILMAEELPERSPSLQVADFIVYEAARWLYDLNHPPRYPLRWLLSKGMSLVPKIASESDPQS